MNCYTMNTSIVKRLIYLNTNKYLYQNLYKWVFSIQNVAFNTHKIEYQQISNI